MSGESMKEDCGLPQELERRFLRIKTDKDGIFSANLIILETVNFRTSKSISRRGI
jgi:hypothetical protein